MKFIMTEWKALIKVEKIDYIYLKTGSFKENTVYYVNAKMNDDFDWPLAKFDTIEEAGIYVTTIFQDLK